MTEWERVIKENRNCWESKDNPVLDGTLIGEYTNYLRLGFDQTKDAITKNVLAQLGYDLEEVIYTKGNCIIHRIVWFSRAWELGKVEYLHVDDKIVGEVRLANDCLSYRWDGKVYGT